MEIVRYLIQQGADIQVCDKEGYNSLDHAVIHCHYDMALLLKKEGLSCKSPEFYERKRDMFVMKEVNVQNFIKNLESENNDFQGPMIRKSQTLQSRYKFKDPVIDPNESWGEMVGRIVNFKEPKLIERSELMKSKKKPSLLHKFNTFVYEETLAKNRQKRSE